MVLFRAIYEIAMDMFVPVLLLLFLLNPYIGSRLKTKRMTWVNTLMLIIFFFSHLYEIQNGQSRLSFIWVGSGIINLLFLLWNAIRLFLTAHPDFNRMVLRVIFFGGFIVNGVLTFQSYSNKEVVTQLVMICVSTISFYVVLLLIIGLIRYDRRPEKGSF